MPILETQPELREEINKLKEKINSLANQSQNDKEIACLMLLRSILIKNIELELAVKNPDCLLQEFVENGTLSIYDMIAGSKIIKDDKNEELSNTLMKSKLYKDGTTISVKELIGRFTSRMMSQIGKDKAKGNITDEQMKSLESFLQNQKLG
jgi:hypothetical protein